MSKLISMIQEAKNLRKEMIASTVRMPPELHSFVDELAEYLSLSRQEALLKLIEEGASVAKEEFNPEKVEESQNNYGFHILNTNKGNSIDDHERMVKDGIAAAFYGEWKFNINRIKKGETVFLYENGVGVVAFGKGTGVTLTRMHEGKKDECHYQELEGFTLLSTPISASEVKKTLNRNVVFLRTMSGMPDGQKLLDKVLLQTNANN